MAASKAVDKIASATPVEAPVAAAVAIPAEAATPAPVETVATPPAIDEKIEKKALPAKAAPSVKKSVPAKPAAPVLKKKAAPAAKPAVAKKRIVKPVRTGLTQPNQGVKIMATKTETPFVGADQFKNAFGDVNARAKAAMEKSAKIAEEFADLTRGNVEALVASSKVAAKGVETLSQEAAEYGRKSFEDASAALKSFAEVKSATDFFKLQSDYARSAFDAAVAESAKVSEAFLKIAGDVAEPITSRYSVAAERVKTLAA